MWIIFFDFEFSFVCFMLSLVLRIVYYGREFLRLVVEGVEAFSVRGFECAIVGFEDGG